MCSRGVALNISYSTQFCVSLHLCQGYRQRNAFIITQGPMENTVGDFWRMVWEMKSAAIVMLTQLQEDGEVSDRRNVSLSTLCLECMITSAPVIISGNEPEILVGRSRRSSCVWQVPC